MRATTFRTKKIRIVNIIILFFLAFCYYCLVMFLLGITYETKKNLYISGGIPLTTVRVQFHRRQKLEYELTLTAGFEPMTSVF